MALLLRRHAMSITGLGDVLLPGFATGSKGRRIVLLGEERQLALLEPNPGNEQDGRAANGQ